MMMLFSGGARGRAAGAVAPSDGGLALAIIPGAGANVPAANFQFLGGIDGPIELGTVGNLFDTVAPSGWDMPGDTGTRISNVETLNGSRSLLHDRALGFQFGFAYDTGAPRRVGFSRWSFLFQNPNNIAGGQLKQARVSGGTSSRLEDICYANAYLTAYSNGDGTGDCAVPRNDSPGVGTNITSGTGREWYREGEWITVHYRVMDSSAAGVADASIQVMTMRESTGEILGVWNSGPVLLRSSAAALVRNLVFQFYMGNNFNTASGCKLYLDRDIACAFSDTTTPPKYIMLGNASTWAACTKRTYCQWADWQDNGATSSILFKANKGGHASLDGLFVYALSDAGTVINTSGAVPTWQ